MIETFDDEQIVDMVRAGGGQALTAMATLIDDGLAYPGDVTDVRALLEDNEPISFGYAPSDLAWTYLVCNGLAEYDGDRWQVHELLAGCQKSPS